MKSHEGPYVLSLRDWQVTVTEDVREYLLETFTEEQLQSVLNRMKVPPAVTICRLIKPTHKDAAEKEIRRLLQTFAEERHCSVEIGSDANLFDVLTIQVRSSSDEQSPQLYSRKFPPSNDGTRGSWPSCKVAIVDRLTGEAVLRGADIFVRGVQCADASIHEGDPVAIYAHMATNDELAFPRGLLLKEFQGTAVFLGTGVAKCPRKTMFTAPSGVAVHIQMTSGPPLPPMHARSDTFILQNMPSCLVAHALDPQEGDIVLDMCAAPGNKTSHLASLCSKCTIVACDKSRKKVLKMQEYFDRLHHANITTVALDTTKCVVEDGSKSVQEILHSAEASKKDGLPVINGFAPESFDRILLDPPCSALGLRPKLQIPIKNRTDLEWNWRYQQKFIRNAVSLLKPGGFMTYSTCTLPGQENEGMVKYLLDSSPTMNLLAIDSPAGGPGFPHWGLTHEEQLAVRRFDPTKADTMGFFLAKFQKKKR